MLERVRNPGDGFAGLIKDPSQSPHIAASYKNGQLAPVSFDCNPAAVLAGLKHCVDRLTQSIRFANVLRSDESLTNLVVDTFSPELLACFTDAFAKEKAATLAAYRRNLRGPIEKSLDDSYQFLRAALADTEYLLAAVCKSLRGWFDLDSSVPNLWSGDFYTTLEKARSLLGQSELWHREMKGNLNGTEDMKSPPHLASAVRCCANLQVCLEELVLVVKTIPQETGLPAFLHAVLSRDNENNDSAAHFVNHLPTSEVRALKLKSEALLSSSATQILERRVDELLRPKLKAEDYLIRICNVEPEVAERVCLGGYPPNVDVLLSTYRDAGVVDEIVNQMFRAKPELLSMPLAEHEEIAQKISDLFAANVTGAFEDNSPVLNYEAFIKGRVAVGPRSAVSRSTKEVITKLSSHLQNLGVTPKEIETSVLLLLAGFAEFWGKKAYYEPVPNAVALSRVRATFEGTSIDVSKISRATKAMADVGLIEEVSAQGKKRWQLAKPSDVRAANVIAFVKMYHLTFAKERALRHELSQEATVPRLEIRDTGELRDRTLSELIKRTKSALSAWQSLPQPDQLPKLERDLGTEAIAISLKTRSRFPGGMADLAISEIERWWEEIKRSDNGAYKPLKPRSNVWKSGKLTHKSLTQAGVAVFIERLPTIHARALTILVSQVEYVRSAMGDLQEFCRLTSAELPPAIRDMDEDPAWDQKREVAWADIREKLKTMLNIRSALVAQLQLYTHAAESQKRSYIYGASDECKDSTWRA